MTELELRSSTAVANSLGRSTTLQKLYQKARMTAKCRRKSWVLDSKMPLWCQRKRRKMVSMEGQKVVSGIWMVSGIWIVSRYYWSGNVYNRVTPNTYKSHVVYMRKEVQGNRERWGLWKRRKGSLLTGRMAAQLHLLVARGGREDPGLLCLLPKNLEI